MLHDDTKLTADVMANWINMQTDENHPDYSCGISAKITGWTPWTGDPDGAILQNFHPEWHPPNGRGVCFLDDEEATGLMNHARGLTDLDERAAAWIAVQKRIVALAPWVFVHHGVIFKAHTDRLKGYNPWPGGIAADMDYAYLE
jgi:peptide/nickel transport system substrate-binding protein